ncbi:hypothetical protein D9M68_542820 [compost metagenome]
MVGTARRASGPGHRTRILLQRFDKVSHRLDVRRGRDDDRFVFAGEARNRRDVLEGDRRFVGQDRADHDIAADDQGVRIALLLACELREADGAAGARHVLNLNVAGDAFLLHDRLKRTRRLVPAAARVCRSDDGVISGEGRQRHGAGENRCEEKMFQRSVLREARFHRARCCSVRTGRLRRVLSTLVA